MYTQNAPPLSMVYNFSEVPRRAQEFRLRRLSAKDSAVALPLLEAQYREHSIDMGGERLARAARALVDGNGVLIVAGRVGVLALSWQFSIERAGRVGWLEELYVAPSHRAQGLGTKLLHRAAEEARRAGCVSLELEVVRGHERAARLYVREGFAALPRRRYSKVLESLVGAPAVRVASSKGACRSPSSSAPRRTKKPR
jgi:GNAT superfamily N-acetyltransferase